MTDLEDRVVAETAGVSRTGAPVSLRPPAPTPTRWRLALPSAIVRAFDERRLIVLLPFAIITGLLVSLQTPSAPDPLALAVVGAIALVAIPVAWRSNTALHASILFAAFWLGFSLFVIHGALFGTGMLRYPAFGTYSMRVDEILSVPETGTRAVVSAITPLGDARLLPIRRARIVVSGLAVAPGDVIAGRVRFYPVPGPVVPNGFDTQFHSYFDGIGAYGNAIGPPVMVSSGDGAAADRVIDSTRRGIAARLDAALAQPSAGIARALITGDQSEVTDQARQSMATAGIAHVLSVSGLHLTIVAGGAYAVLRLLLALSGTLASRWPVKRFAALGGILAALLYYGISGGNIAALRSTIMILLVMGAVVFGRQAFTMRNVAIAGLIVVVSDPAGVFRPSFQLSFAAVVALIGAWEMLSRRRKPDHPPRPRLVRYILGIVSTSLIAGAATLLFTIYHFQQTSPLGVLGNLAVLPLVTFIIMPAALLGTVLMPLGFEQPVLHVLGWGIDWMLAGAAIVANLSGGLSASPLLTPVALGLGLAAFAWFAFLPTWHRLIAPALLLPAVLLFALDGPPDIIVSDTTQAVAIRGSDGLELVAGKAGTFAVDVWQDTYGEPIASRSKLLLCDSTGCFGSSPRGFSLALVKDPAAFFEDCGSADVVIARIEAPSTCRAPVMIDAGDLARFGVHWLRWDTNDRHFDVRTAIPPNDRPWRPWPMTGAAR